MAEFFESLLFPELDKRETAKNVNKFLRTEFPSCVRIAGTVMSELQSPNYSGMPKGSPIGNPAESTIVRRTNAKMVVDATMNAMGCCDVTSQRILRLCYISQYEDEIVQEKIGYQRTRFYYYKNEALRQFADCYKLDDLNIYLND